MENIPSNDKVDKGGIDFLCADVMPLLPTVRLQYTNEYICECAKNLWKSVSVMVCGRESTIINTGDLASSWNMVHKENRL